MTTRGIYAFQLLGFGDCGVSKAFAAASTAAMIADDVGEYVGSEIES